MTPPGRAPCFSHPLRRIAPFRSRADMLEQWLARRGIYYGWAVIGVMLLNSGLMLAYFRNRHWI